MKIIAGLPFGMSSTGTLPADGGADEWSTEDEDCRDNDVDDSEGDDSDNGDDAEENIFEPMAKSYYHMNLKEAAGQERDLEDDGEEEAKRKLKNAKKKTDKRRKQKEKKLKENAEKELEEERARAKEELARQQLEEQTRIRREELRYWLFENNVCFYDFGKTDVLKN